jgi:CheY-like chemotaxis protein
MNDSELTEHPLNGRLILIVDDEQDNIEVFQEILEMSGAKVITAQNGSEGLEMMNQHPDLIIADIAMPVMNGYELLDALKGDPKTAEIPVIVLTGHVLESYRTAAFAAGAYYFLIKPVISVSLLEMVSEALGSPYDG